VYLARYRCALDQTPAGFGQLQFPASPIIRGGTPLDETLLYQPLEHCGHRTLVSVGALGQVIDGAGRRCRELLEHEELGAANSELPLSGPGGAAEHTHNSPEGIQRSGKLRVNLTPGQGSAIVYGLGHRSKVGDTPSAASRSLRR
jgi:hypothetical protein